MAVPKPADPFVWGAVLTLVVVTTTFVAGLLGYEIKEIAAGTGGVFFVGMLAAWVRNLPLR